MISIQKEVLERAGLRNVDGIYLELRVLLVRRMFDTLEDYIEENKDELHI